MVVVYSSDEETLVVEYETDNGPATWVMEKLRRTGNVTIAKVFFFNDQDLLPPEPDETDPYEDEDNSVRFRLGTLHGEYYRISGRMLGIEQDVFFFKEYPIALSCFAAERKRSIFKRIARLSPEDIFIGGPAETAIPESDFEKLLQQFPNSYELDRYVDARLAAILRNYLNQSKDAVNAYHRYLDKKIVNTGKSPLSRFTDYEIEKYQSIVEHLQQMLNAESAYSEKHWQREILKVFQLVYPQYILALDETRIPDTISGKERRVDFVLVDRAGHIDALEIKKPFGQAIMTPGTYRDNHIPQRELTGTVMQLEKYLYHLARSGTNGERKIQKQYDSRLPDGLAIHITNPRGMIIIGRDNELTERQELDFEVVRRQYRNIVDILTYDDLIRRLIATIGALKTITS